MEFTLERSGLITGEDAGRVASVVTTEGGWAATLTDADGEAPLGVHHTLERALAAVAAAVADGLPFWSLDLPCGDRLVGPLRRGVADQLRERGYEIAEGGRAYLSLTVPAATLAAASDAAVQRAARVAMLTVLDPAERAVLGSVDLVERAGSLLHFCADLPLPISGFVHHDLVMAHALSCLSPGAAALAVSAEADWADAIAPAPVMGR